MNPDPFGSDKNLVQVVLPHGTLVTILDQVGETILFAVEPMFWLPCV